MSLTHAQCLMQQMQQQQWRVAEHLAAAAQMHQIAAALVQPAPNKMAHLACVALPMSRQELSTPDSRIEARGVGSSFVT